MLTALFAALGTQPCVNAYQSEPGNSQNRSHDRGHIVDRHCSLLASETIAVIKGNIPEAWILSYMGGDQRKRLMGTAFPRADRSLSSQLPGSRVNGNWEFDMDGDGFT